MNSETWGLLASPPKDMVVWQRRRRARRVAKARIRLQAEDNAAFFTTLATQSRDRKRYELIRKALTDSAELSEETIEHIATTMCHQLQELDK